LEFELQQTAATGLLFAVIGLGSTVAALAIARFGGRLRYKPIIAGGSLVAGLVFLGVTLPRSFFPFLLGFGLLALLQGAMVPRTNALLAVRTPEGRHGTTFGLASTLQSTAMLIGPVAGGLTSGTLGNHAVYAMMGILLLVAALLAGMALREPEV
jgi:MFS family permease